MDKIHGHPTYVPLTAALFAYVLKLLLKLDWTAATRKVLPRGGDSDFVVFVFAFFPDDIILYISHSMDSIKREF